MRARRDRQRLRVGLRVAAPTSLNFALSHELSPSATLWVAEWHESKWGRTRETWGQKGSPGGISLRNAWGE
jgi:hypothetical protein